MLFEPINCINKITIYEVLRGFYLLILKLPIIAEKSLSFKNILGTFPFALLIRKQILILNNHVLKS